MAKLVLIFKTTLLGRVLRAWFFVFNLIVLIRFTTAQDSSFAKHLVYIEAGGMGGWGSLNYEHNVKQFNILKLGFRCGINAMPLMDYTKSFNPDLALPLTLVAQYGVMHCFVLSFGTVFSSTIKTDIYTINVQRNNNLNASIAFGYRFKKKYTKGFMLQCMYVPLFYGIDFSKHWAGFGFGYAF